MSFYIFFCPKNFLCFLYNASTGNKGDIMYFHVNVEGDIWNLAIFVFGFTSSILYAACKDQQNSNSVRLTVYILPTNIPQ